MANINGNEIYFGIIGQVGQDGGAAAGLAILKMYGAPAGDAGETTVQEDES